MIPLSSGPVPGTAEAVIIGGGINGLATARELAREGLKNIVIIEKGYLGCGSTGRCGGGIRQQWTSEDNIHLARESVVMYEKASRCMKTCRQTSVTRSFSGRAAT